MLFGGDYKTISNFPESSITEHGSKFISFAYHVSNEKEMKQYLENLKQKYPDATHHCYACVLNPDKSFVKSNDDGEPSNTAGKPILKQINKRDLTNILLIVVRYFGGKKLGIPGLISAYGNAASICLDNAETINKKLSDYYKISSDVDKNFEIYNIIKKYRAKIVETNTGKKTEIVISIDRAAGETLLKECKLLATFEVKYLKTE